MKRVVWERAALEDLEEAIGFIAERDRRAALVVESRVLETIEILAIRPIGRPGKLAGTFEKRVLRTLYRIIYAMDETQLTILRVMHGSRNWPLGEGPED